MHSSSNRLTRLTRPLRLASLPKTASVLRSRPLLRAELLPGAVVALVAAVTLVAGLLGPTPASAQAHTDTPASAVEAAVQSMDYFFPEGTTFDEAIPSPEEFLGYAIGTHHTRHDRIVSYLEELARLSDRATYQSLGRSIEHRDLPVLTVTSPANHARLDDIRETHLAALDPANDPIPASDRPVVVHLGYGVHGNETSSSEVAMLKAYWLVAGQGSEVERILDEGIWHIEPVLNPDGRDRHTNWANMHKADPFVADALDREHNEVWPGGRTNHYWFDLNRDWLPLQDPSSRARIDFHHRWMPNVVTDYHEMGTSSTYFFEPTKPEGSWNPLLPEELYTDITLRFAADWAASLDELGSLYFTKEVFDNTYPGYGSTYPNFLGGLGLVFEQASARGHIQESTHHGVLTFAYAIRNQLRTSISTVRTAVEEKERMLDYQRDFFTGGLEEAAAGAVRGWVFGSATDHSLNREFLDLLLRHRIEVHELAEPVEVQGREFDTGASWVVSADQPHIRLARSVFETTDTYADSVFYDASTWTMSLAYGMPHAESTSALPAGDRVTDVPGPLGRGDVPEARYAWLLDWSDYYAPRALQYLLARGVRVEAAFEPFTARVRSARSASATEHTFSRGTISIPLQIQNLAADEVHRLVREAEAHSGVPFHAADTGYSLDGIDLGSRGLRPLSAMPRVLMVVGSGVSSNEAGQVWHLLDTRVDLPLTKVDRDQLGRVDFANYDVVVLVTGNYGFMSDGQLAELRRFVQRGGTLVAVRGGANWAVGQGFAPRLSQAMDAWEDPAEPFELPERPAYEDAGLISGAQAIGGSIYRAHLDRTHPLGFGYTEDVIPVWRDHSFIRPPSANPYSTPVQLTDDPHLSGYISDRNLERLRGTASVVTDGIGGGTVVLFFDNPNFRGYWYGTNRLFLNAIFFGRYISVPGVPG